MIKIEDHTTSDLDELAEEHYQKLIGKKNKKGIYPQRSLISKIEFEKSNPQNTDFKQIKFWEYLSDKDYSNLKLLIIARPKELKELIEDIETKFGRKLFSIEKDYNNARVTSFGAKVKGIFDFESYRDSTNAINNCRQFKIKYCPYCNTTPLSIFDERKLLDIDHFYPRSRHPYLAVSFFNLIPSCPTCNERLKKDKMFDINTHFNPFHKRFDDYFEFYLDTVLVKTKDDVIIKYRCKKHYLPNAINDFKIIERYNDSHKGDIFSLINTFKNHKPSVLESMRKQFRNLFPNKMSNTQNLLNNFGVPFKQSNINELHLGKLKRDLAIQLKVL